MNLSINFGEFCYFRHHVVCVTLRNSFFPVSHLVLSSCRHQGHQFTRPPIRGQRPRTPGSSSLFVLIPAALQSRKMLMASVLKIMWKVGQKSNIALSNDSATPSLIENIWLSHHFQDSRKHFGQNEFCRNDFKLDSKTHFFCSSAGLL